MAVPHLMLGADRSDSVPNTIILRDSHLSGYARKARPITASKWSALKSWAVRVAQRRGAKRGKVALARKLAVVLHRMWVSETDFRYATKQA